MDGDSMVLLLASQQKSQLKQLLPHNVTSEGKSYCYKQVGNDIQCVTVYVYLMLQQQYFFSLKVASGCQ